jgi:hypothetical protein
MSPLRADLDGEPNVQCICANPPRNLVTVCGTSRSQSVRQRTLHWASVPALLRWLSGSTAKEPCQTVVSEWRRAVGQFSSFMRHIYGRRRRHRVLESLCRLHADGGHGSFSGPPTGAKVTNGIDDWLPSKLPALQTYQLEEILGAEQGGHGRLGGVSQVVVVSTSELIGVLEHAMQCQYGAVYTGGLSSQFRFGTI